jgi:hypothetical protein
MPVAPALVAPRDDVPCRVEVGLEVDRHRRAERRPCHLVGPRPLHTHRTALRREREARGIERDVVGAVVAIASGALHVRDDDLLPRHVEGEREIAAQVVDALAVGPDAKRVAVELRESA